MEKQNVAEKFKLILNYLVKERKRQKISQNEMAKRLNITQQTYCKIESGTHKMTAIQLLQITPILKLDYSILEGFLSDSEKNETPLKPQIDETNFLQKHIDDCHILIEQQQRIIEKLTSRES